MELYKRTGSPFWYFDMLVDGKRVRRSTKEKRKTAASVIMSEALTTSRADMVVGPKRITLADAVEAYGADLRAQGKPWGTHVHHIANKMFGTGPYVTRGRFKLDGGMTLDQLTESVLHALQAARRDEGMSVATIAQELKILRSATLRSGREGYTTKAIRWGVKVPKGKTRWLSGDEWRKVYDEMDPDRLVMRRPHGAPEATPMPVHAYMKAQRVQARDLFVALSLCGGRWGEVSRMTVDQVLFEGDGVRLRLYGWKTSKERMVPVPPLMEEVLRRRAEAAKAAGTLFLFRPSASGRKPWEPRDYQKSSGAIGKAIDRAGCNDPHLVERHGRATIHSLRHTFASWLRQNGVALGEIKELLGHETDGMTMRYAHIAPDATVSLASTTITAIVDRAMGQGVAA